MIPGNNYPSIFNDVIGPVMRGPSSSHCAASVRIGRIARDFMDGYLDSVLVEYERKGSLASTHDSQGSDNGLFSGLLGYETDDERLNDAKRLIHDSGIKTDILISDYKADHPNTYRLTLSHKQDKHQMTAISTGGGLIEFIEIDGHKLSVKGDYYETLIFTKQCENIHDFLKSSQTGENLILLNNSNRKMLQVKSGLPLESKLLEYIHSNFEIDSIRCISPVLPVLSFGNNKSTFITASQMHQYNKNKNLSLGELGLLYEMERGGIQKEHAVSHMKKVLDVMKKSVRTGLAGTHFKDRILGYQSEKFEREMNRGRLLDGGVMNRITCYVTAAMESKSAYETIVAAPTAGSCGILPGILTAMADDMKISDDELVYALFAAGLIGVFISARSTFAAEVCGCQAECGSGSGMAAAAFVNIMGGDAESAASAASMALQNILGMVCDPVAARVEVPCLGKNVLAASNAFVSANMALSDFDAVIPLDEVIEAMDRTGRSLPASLRCTAQGGLSVSQTSHRIEKSLNGV